jgi:hypothetical protein
VAVTVVEKIFPMAQFKQPLPVSTIDKARPLAVPAFPAVGDHSTETLGISPATEVVVALVRAKVQAPLTGVTPKVGRSAALFVSAIVKSPADVVVV